MKSQFLKPLGDLSLSLSASKTVLVPVRVQDQHCDCPCTACSCFLRFSICTLPRAEVTWKTHCSAVAPVIIFTAVLRSAQAVRSHQEGTSCSVFYPCHEKLVNAQRSSIRRRCQAQPVFSPPMSCSRNFWNRSFEGKPAHAVLWNHSLIMISSLGWRCFWWVDVYWYSLVLQQGEKSICIVIITKMLQLTKHFYSKRGSVAQEDICWACLHIRKGAREQYLHNKEQWSPKEPCQNL